MLNRLSGKMWICLLLLAANPMLACAQSAKPDWAFPKADKVVPSSSTDPARLHTLPDSKLALTWAQIDEMYYVPDWFPDMYPTMPEIVRSGNRKTGIHACGACHLPTGTGHDESAWLAGLPVSYFLRQLADFRSGDRKGSDPMSAIAAALTEDESRRAAEYYSSLQPRPWIRVVESSTVPRTYVAANNKRLRHPEGGTEALVNRIIEIAEDEQAGLNRDPRSGYIAYVPPGSIDKGRELVTTGGNGKTDPCALCHGESLHGMGDIPALAGRHPNYIVRQLWNFQNGERKGASNEEMQIEVEELSVDDMLAIAAYLGSLTP